MIAYYDFDSKKHSSIISYFNKNFIKTEEIEKQYSKFLTKAFKIRNDSDYEDFFIISKDEVKEQLKNAKEFIERIEKYIQENIYK
ncbi:hypothetical protein HLVA_14410 [Haliovirga abyssi]|uniref:HEPN domain-containing protein n=1 Tax=Haliovirga abyssi TaxID=2996794 RepID=A0AAU9DH89_9FUSO|nr:hypothetical protein HLVA_14410 [Haliovirga abyssi]